MAKMTLDTGQDKIDKIATLLRKQTLEPAEGEAERVLEEARGEAERIVRESKEEAEALHKAARQEIARERSVFESSLGQASKQALEELRQQIEQSLFSDELDLAAISASSDPQAIVRLIEAVVEAIDQQGVECDLTLVLPKTLTKKALEGLLAERILKRFSEGGMVIGDFDGGARLQLVDKKITLDVSDVALRELLKRYVRKDFRELLFGSE